LSVLLRYTDSDCPFGIFKLFYRLMLNLYSRPGYTWNTVRWKFFLSSLLIVYLWVFVIDGWCCRDVDIGGKQMIVALVNVIAETRRAHWIGYLPFNITIISRWQCPPTFCGLQTFC